jgi:hypothetical protein
MHKAPGVLAGRASFRPDAMSTPPLSPSAADIGEPYHACMLLRQSRARLDAMLETIGDAFFAVDLRLPIDVLKLDRSFVLCDDGRISAFDFIKAFVDMAHALHMAVVAEGVETRAVLDFLRAANCDEVQGCLLARPMPPNKLRALLAHGVSLSSIS